MKIIKVLGWALILIWCLSPVSFAATEYNSFVDEMIYSPKVLAEDPADEFYKEKCEINQLILEENFNDAIRKMDEIENKASAKYGNLFRDWSLTHQAMKFIAIILEKNTLDFSAYSETELQQKLRDENTWKNFYAELDKILEENHVYSPIIKFRLDKKIVNICQENLGEYDPTTLKHKITLARDYSVLGDSKFALEMEKNLLPQVQKTFGAKSAETAELLALMAEDYKILGNYAKSEETLFKAIEINNSALDEKSSLELLKNLIDLIDLKKVSQKDDYKLYNAMENLAKNVSEEDLYRLGYFHTKALYTSDEDFFFEATEPIPNKDAELLGLEEVFSGSQYGNFDYRHFTKYLHMVSEFSEWYRPITSGAGSMYLDAICLEFCEHYLGNYHHKTLMAMCNLSEDYTCLNQLDDALFLAQEAYDTGKKYYGNEHPCTVKAIHSLTGVYRKMGQFSNALELDQQAYDICKKNFVGASKNDTAEILTVMEDLSNDYVGLKNNAMAVKYCEELVSKSDSFSNTFLNKTKKIAMIKKFGGSV